MQIYCGLIHQESSKQTICKVGVTDLAFWHSFWQFSHAVIAYTSIIAHLHLFSGKNMVKEHTSPRRSLSGPVVERDRIITKFQCAFHTDGTPYKKFDFHPRVRQACSANKTGTVGYLLVVIFRVSLCRSQFYHA